MPPDALATFMENLSHCPALDAEQRQEVVRLQAEVRTAPELAQELLRREWLTAFQVNQIFQGKGAELVLGPYLILERIGVGGMGQVFKARQKLLNRIVALKVIRKECLSNRKVILRFQREIRMAGQLSHPHIVRAYDADQANGVHYIAMEYIDGIDLAKLVVESGPLPVDRACEYIRQAALGLQHAFERGMVHRDIKPANLLVTRGMASDRRRSSGLIPRPGELNVKRSGVLQRAEATLHYPFGIVKILDLGLARGIDASTGRAVTHLTHFGSVMGTPDFIAPEQARDSHTSDIRADIYSLGCTLYFLLTGQAPFAEGTIAEKLMQHQCTLAPPVARVRRERLHAWRGPNGSSANTSEEMLYVPPPVAGLLRKLLAKRPEERFQSPIHLASELQSVLTLIADGKLRPEIGSAQMAITKELPALPAPIAESATTEDPIILLTPKPSSSSARKRAGIVIAALTSLACFVLLSGAAIVMSAGNSMRAHPHSHEADKSKTTGDDGKPQP